MTVMEAMNQRHAVRNYSDKKIPEDIILKLKEEIKKCNKEGDLNIQLELNDSSAFEHLMPFYGNFSGIQNYIALIGKKTSSLDEKIGYYGEKIALFAQTLGLNSCWVAMTFNKSATKRKCQINADEKLVCVLIIGYGETQGVPHKSKNMEEVCRITENTPEWFKNGVSAALLAPTASNQQKFRFFLEGTNVSLTSSSLMYSKVDAGILKYHFEQGAGKSNFTWK